MPVRGLQRYLKDRGLFHSGRPSEILKDSTLAIDAYYFLQRSTRLLQEPMQVNPAYFTEINPVPIAMGSR
eukprot:251971-Amorphochlora_amoeboformis.AAC.1